MDCRSQPIYIDSTEEVDASILLNVLDAQKRILNPKVDYHQFGIKPIQN